MTRQYLFHGGIPGLSEGERILPPSETKTASTTLQATIDAGLEEISQRQDKVYLTSIVELARGYASLWTDPATGVAGGGWVYKVEVTDGTMESDQDLLSSEGVSYQAGSALIVGVHAKNVAFNQNRYHKVFRKVLNSHNASKKAQSKVTNEQAVGGEVV
jgi:hypothetical protein